MRNYKELFHYFAEHVGQPEQGSKIKERSYPSQGDMLRESSMHYHAYLSEQYSGLIGIFFSPPYSFAVNYLKNDSFHLQYMGEDLEELQGKMIGLRGKTLNEKYRLYLEDMNKVLSECARLLKPAHFCTIIIGTNDQQLSKVLGMPSDKVRGLHQILIDNASKYGFVPVRLL